MLAVTVTPGGSPALRELPSPTAPPGGVLVRVRACGLCGSDVEKLRPGGAAAGSVLGHEIAGVVVDGALPAGLRVALAHHVPCGACASCEAGHEPLCAAFVASALEPGGFCELTAASAGHVAHAALPLPDHVSDLAGSFVEPLACVLRGIEGLSGDALVAGAGSIGLLAAQALRARGAHVRVLEPEPGRARRAAALGFDAARGGRALRRRAALGRRPRSPTPCRCSSPAGSSCSSAAACRSRSTSSWSTAASSSCAACAPRRRAICARRCADRERRRRVREPRRLRAGARGVRRGPGPLHAARGAQGRVRTVIAARYWAPRDVRVEHVAEPEPGAGEVVLRIEAALTCGTDAKCYRRGHPVLLGPAPAPFGHEYAGVVVACGEDAPFKEGDLVCGVNSAPCGQCTACVAGREELCSDLYPLLNGAYAQLLRVPARIARVNLHRVPEGVRPRSPPPSSRWLAPSTAPTTPTSVPASASRSSAAARSAGCSRSPARRAGRSPICSAGARARRAATRP